LMMSETVFLFDIISDAPEGMVQLARTGSFYREDQGKFKVTKMMLLQMRDNAMERALDIPIKITHEDSRQAAGWVDCMTLSVQPWRTGFGLFGKVSWSTDTKDKLKGGKYRYISPEINWSGKRYADSKRGLAGEPIGPMLLAAALVLTPFFDMEPVRFSLAAGKRQYSAGDNMYLGIEALPMLKEFLAGKVEGLDAGKVDALSAELLIGLMEYQRKMHEMEMAKAEEKVAEEVSGEPKLEIEIEGMGEEMSEELVASQMPMDSLQASVGRIATAFGLKATTDTAVLVATAEAKAKAYDVLAKKVASLEASAAKQAEVEKQALFSKYQSEGRFRMFSVAGTDPDGSKAAGEILSKGVDVFSAVFGKIAPLTEAASPASPEMPERSSSTGEGMVSFPAEAEIHKFAADKGVTYGQAVKALLKK
jgi:phage I-like protein